MHTQVFFSQVFFFEKSKNSKKSSQKNSPEQRAPRLVQEHFFWPKKPIFSTKNLIFCENFLKIRFLKIFFWAKKIDFSTKKKFVPYLSIWSLLVVFFRRKKIFFSTKKKTQQKKTQTSYVFFRQNLFMKKLTYMKTQPQN